MAVCELNYFSAALGMAVGARVILPQGKFAGPYSVFYLLHGLSDDHTIWTRRTSLERYVEDKPLIVVMPDGGRGFYCDAAEGFAYQSAIINDLIPYIDSTFQTRRERAGRCIGGLSMGGYGAIKLALQYPGLFVSANGHSGAYSAGHGFRSDQPEFERIYGSAMNGGGPNDVFRLAAEIDRSKCPALRIDCGTEDFLIEDNRSFHAHLKKKRIAHEYAEYPGAHNWAYWDLHIQEALAFHLRHLGLLGGARKRRK